ncbi:aminotransferase class V-fold PLP-dependent enzyme [Lentzea sp. NPDC051838]|uniref:aminotransferase class V-fold PLP-dependent enzyme n=1 Tax=Lentzea sp. NPDC051838 TaxID=3154849 RepID=UPI00342D4F6F
MTYLASCSQGAFSRTLGNAVVEYQQTLLRHGAAWELWMSEVDRARQLFANLINASLDEIAVVPTLSNAAYQVASTRDWFLRSRIVTTDMEFPSVAHVWLAQRANGAKVSHVEDRGGVVEPEDYLALIDETCGIVSIPLISYRNGARLPVKEVVAAARKAGAATFVDAYQGAGVEPIDVREIGCDFLAAGALKFLLGLPGIAFLYVRAGVEDSYDPPATGWFGRRDPFGFNPRELDYPKHARRFESGTPAIPAAYGAVAGMRVLGELDPHVVRKHVTRLGHYAQHALEDERFSSPLCDSLRGPQIALLDENPTDLAAYLNSRRIVTSPRGNAVRIALHYYNTTEDVDALVTAVRDYRRLT